MVDCAPAKEDMINILGESLFLIWNGLQKRIDEKYDMDRIWDKG